MTLTYKMQPAENQSTEAKAAIAASGSVDSIEINDKPVIKDKQLTWLEVAKGAKKRAEYEGEDNESVFTLPGHAMDGMVCAVQGIVRHFGPLSFAEVFEIPVDAHGKTFGIPKPQIPPTQPGCSFEIPGSPLVATLIYAGAKASIKLSGTNAHKQLMAFIMEQIELEWRERSIFRGAALRVTAHGHVSFVKLNGDTELVFAPNVEREIAACIMSRIERRQDMRNNRIPLKLGVLLYGPFGTGKTALALKLAKMATARSLNYLECADPGAFASVARMAEMYRESIILLEDVERLSEEAHVQDLVNWMDGVSTKGLETMLICTTNDLAKVNSGMGKLLRPGRIDHLIYFPRPGQQERQRLFYLELPGMDGDISAAVAATDGCNAAAIRQIAQRAKQMAIYAGEPCDPLAAVHVNDAAQSYLSYLKAVEDSQSETAPTIDGLLGELVEERVRKAVD